MESRSPKNNLDPEDNFFVEHSIPIDRMSPTLTLPVPPSVEETDAFNKEVLQLKSKQRTLNKSSEISKLTAEMTDRKPRREAKRRKEHKRGKSPHLMRTVPLELPPPEPVAVVKARVQSPVKGLEMHQLQPRLSDAVSTFLTPVEGERKRKRKESKMSLCQHGKRNNGYLCVVRGFVCVLPPYSFLLSSSSLCLLLAMSWQRDL